VGVDAVRWVKVVEIDVFDLPFDNPGFGAGGREFRGTSWEGLAWLD